MKKIVAMFLVIMLGTGLFAFDTPEIVHKAREDGAKVQEDINFCAALIAMLRRLPTDPTIIDNVLRNIDIVFYWANQYSKVHVGVASMTMLCVRMAGVLGISADVLLGWIEMMNEGVIPTTEDIIRESVK